MSADVALRPSGRLAIEDGQDFWTPEQVAGLSVLGIKGATNGDLAVFFHYCRRTQLDPFSRQIYMIQRRTKERWQDERGGWHEEYVSKQTIQVGIDGFRVVRDRVAERTGYTCDFEDTIWYDDDGNEHAVWLEAKPPAACRVVLVKRQPGQEPLRFPAVLRTASYMQVNGKGEPVSQWRTQAEHMIEKCCEAFATRRAFPNDFSGVYLEDEMSGRVAEPQPPPQRRVTAADIIREPETGPEPEPDAEVAGEDAADEPDRYSPGTATKAQLDALWATFTQDFQFTKDDRQQARETIEKIIGRKLVGGTTGNLSANEALTVIGTLKRCGTRDRLMVLLATGELPQDEPDSAGEEGQPA